MRVETSLPSAASTCASCGALLPANALSGICPRCLAEALKMSRTLQGSFTTKEAALLSSEAAVEEAQTFATRGDYLEIGESLGVGGMGEVRTARDRKLTRTVAVKRLRSDREQHQGAVARFLAEARIASTLEHPGIVPIYDVGIDAQGSPFYTMRLVRGENLGRVLERLAHGDSETASRYPLATLLNLFQQVCDAVAYAHSRGVIHRDLKPENIMLGEFGQVVVMDWGLAKILEDADAEEAPPAIEPTDRPEPSPLATEHLTGESRPPKTAEVEVLPAPEGLTRPDVIMGSLGYMAPEQAGGRAYAADARADIYALGAILYHLLALRPPIRGRDARLMLDRTTGGDIRPPTDFNPGGATEVQKLPLIHLPNRRVPAALSAVAMKALATRPEDRYPTVADLRQDLVNWLNGFPVNAEGAGMARHMKHWARRHRVLVTAATLVVLLAAGFSWSNWRTLRRLNGTAPTFAELAESLAHEQKLEDALRNVNFALRLAPEDAGYLALKGNLLLGLLRVEEAREAFVAARKLGAVSASAETNLTLCEQLRVQRRPDKSLPPEALTELYRNFILHDRPGEALAIFARLQDQRESLFAFWKDRLDRAGIQGTLVQAPDGRFEFTITGGRLDDLAPLAGMPLAHLRADVKNLAFTNLAPLRGMSLEGIHLGDAPVSDLRPLAGMPLKSFSVWGAKNLADISVLRGMKLESVGLDGTAVTDLTPLAGMPISVLGLGDTRIRDLSPVTNSPIRNLTLGRTPFTNFTQAAALPLVELILSGTSVDDLTPLAQRRELHHLDLQQTRVSDLRPLQFVPLNSLYLSGTPVRDISVLRGKSLKRLFLTACVQLHDLSPLAECRELEELGLPPAPGDIEFLRGFPKLVTIDGLSVADFWKSYDARRATRR